MRDGSLIGPQSALGLKSICGGEAAIDDEHGAGDIEAVVAGEEQDGSRDIFRLASNAGVQVRHLRPSVPTLEDVFAHAVGEK